MPFTPCIQNQQNSFQTIEKPHIHRGLCTFLENFYQIFFCPLYSVLNPFDIFRTKSPVSPSFRHKNPANCKGKERTHRISLPMNKFTVYFFSIPFFSKIQKKSLDRQLFIEKFPSIFNLFIDFSIRLHPFPFKRPDQRQRRHNSACVSSIRPWNPRYTEWTKPPILQPLSKRGSKSAIPFFHHLKIHLPIPYYNQYFSIIL